MYRSMWERAMDEMIAKLIVQKGGLTYVAELQSCALCIHILCKRTADTPQAALSPPLASPRVYHVISACKFFLVALLGCCAAASVCCRHQGTGMNLIERRKCQELGLRVVWNI